MQISDLIPIGKLGIPPSRKDDFLIFRCKEDVSLDKLKDIFLVFPDHRVRYVTIDKVIGDKQNHFSIMETEVIDEIRNIKNVAVMLDPETWNCEISDSSNYLWNFKVKFKGELIGRVKSTLQNPGQTVLIVKTEQQDFMVPNVPEYVSEIDEKQKCIVLKNIEELLQL